jgi:alkaline phosphatase D
VISRRSFLAGSASSLVAAACRRSPQVVTRQPSITHGVQAGDVESTRAVVWARCSEPARMIVEWATKAGGPWTSIAGDVVVPGNDHTGTVVLDRLPAEQRIEYRVRFEREAARGRSEVASGSFELPSSRSLRVAWTGDTCGQGYGRNPEWGGLRGYAALRAAKPDVLVHSGDMIYADNPILPEMPLADGRVWRNVSSERVARVAQELDDFRARFAYNLEDEHVRALLAEVPLIAQWDDHETHNNWWPGQTLDDARYAQRSASVLSARARKAFFEWNAVQLTAPAATFHRVVRHGPLLDVFVLDARTFRTPNDTNDREAKDMLGSAQVSWLVDALAASRARFKLIACDQPISTVIPDGDRGLQEGFANGIDGVPRGREREIARLLTAMQQREIRNTLWVTADVHYAAAHHFDPARTTFPFSPFWEFVAGPIHAGTFGPNPLDPSLGGEVRFEWAPPPGTGNLAPWDGLQTFGTLDVSPEAIRVALWGIDGRERFRVELPYEA